MKPTDNIEEIIGKILEKNIECTMKRQYYMHYCDLSSRT